MNHETLSTSIIGITDSYKVSHWRQYPPGTSQVRSYWESRGGEFDEIVFFGLHYYLREYLSRPVTFTQADYWQERFAKHFGDPYVYNADGWDGLVKAHDGKLPIRIRAVPEGTVVPAGNAMLTVEATDPRFAWLVNYVETILSMLWYPSTVATLSREAKRTIARYAMLTGADPAGVPFKLHDFGFRGVSSYESAAIGAAAHLVNFMGTDTLAGLEMVKRYYGEEMAGFSIPAAEHSTITSWGGPDQEIDAFRNMVEQFGHSKSGLYAVVSDSYDIMRAVDAWGTDLKDAVLAAKNVLVVRPDSGDVRSTVAAVIERLGTHFGYTKNAAGYKVLNKVRVIQGDGMDLGLIESVCHVLRLRGWSIDNIAFGMGGGLLQKVNRDTARFAFKASSIVVNGVERDVWKDPVTDSSKRSKRGDLRLVRRDGEFATVRKQDVLPTDEEMLQVVYENGEVIGAPPKFSDIRERAALVEEPVSEEVVLV